jgi:hypothetical protein
MTKREYSRRSDEDLLGDLENKLSALKKKFREKNRPDAPALKEMKKVKKALTKFSQICVDNGRTDLANSVLAFLHTLEHQSKTLPHSLQPK